MLILSLLLSILVCSLTGQSESLFDLLGSSCFVECEYLLLDECILQTKCQWDNNTNQCHYISNVGIDILLIIDRYPYFVNANQYSFPGKNIFLQMYQTFIDTIAYAVSTEIPKARIARMFKPTFILFFFWMQTVFSWMWHFFFF